MMDYQDVCELDRLRLRDMDRAAQVFACDDLRSGPEPINFEEKDRYDLMDWEENDGN